jgi:hypothetical protein
VLLNPLVVAVELNLLSTFTDAASNLALREEAK